MLLNTHQFHGTKLKGATAERCIMVMCLLGRSSYRGLWDDKNQRTKQRTKLDRINRILEALAYGCLDGRRREGAILVQQSWQWSAAKAGVTAAPRLHDATNAYLAMKHDVTKQAANEMTLKEVDKSFFDQRIPLAVGTISDEEGEIDILARSGT